MDGQDKVEKVLRKADILINGSRPWDIQVHHNDFVHRALKEPSLGFGESYMDKWWDCERLDECFFRVCRELSMKDMYSWFTLIKFLLHNSLIDPQSPQRSKQVAEQHYNLGNDLYTAMLGPSMAYTCGYWKDTDDLDQAQYAKYDLICRKLQLKPGEKVLELGCGFGGFARYAAENYGVEMFSVNISTKQMEYAKELCKDFPVQLFICDYRNESYYNPQRIKFDKIVSIGLCEHVGYKNYKNLLKIARNNLKENGLFLLHTIGKRHSMNFADPWIRKYIFPQGMLPSLKLLSEASEPYFVTEDVHNFGADYDKTLVAWNDNFEKHWPQLKNDYSERFYRMWRYYLLSCAGAFRSRNIELYQVVFSPKGVVGGYESVR